MNLLNMEIIGQFNYLASVPLYSNTMLGFKFCTSALSPLRACISKMDGFKSYAPAATKVFFNDKRYHVFLSFRGRDVRKTLVDHLFQALSAAGLEVFVDSHKIKKGEIIDLSLQRAIESSAIRVPIFSKGYAGSAWCLTEAGFMLASPDLIIPLFYEMEPTHVRYPDNESSPYNKSFQKHYGHPDRYLREEVDEWKRILQHISCRSGWSLAITAGFEAQLVKKVVSDIIKILDKVPLEVAKHQVGLEALRNALLQKLHLNSAGRTVRVGIWGIGGIGKTTHAKAVYNEIYDNFDAASFVFNVRSTSLKKLQGKILKDFVNYTEEVDSVEKGISLFRHRLGGLCVLLILDDVDDRLQLDALAGDWLASGSRVVITSRDKHILNAAHISSTCIQEMNRLGRSDSLKLFSWHAFLRPSPIPGYEEFSKRIAEACKGHPLPPEVIGAFLYDKQDENDIDCWNETLYNISVNRDIFERLKISYSGLNAEEKEIFLDIACYFIGERTTFPTAFWKSMYTMVDTAIINLSMKLLIKIDEKCVFAMDDLVRDMGLIIAKEEHTRQWETAQSSGSFNSFSSLNISRLRLYKGDSKRLKMLCRSNLRYLHLEQVHIEDIIDSLPPSLIWLKVDSCSFPITLHSSKSFDLNLAMKKKSISVSGIRSELRIMELTNCRPLRIFPDTISHLSLLQSLNLSGCHKLDCAPNTISNLSQLLYLNLSYCEKLRYLPDSIGNLSHLQYLNLTCCKILIKLPNIEVLILHSRVTWIYFTFIPEKLESKLTKIRLFPGKSFFRNKSKLELKLPDKIDSCRRRFQWNMSSCPMFSAKAQPLVTRNITSCSAEKESERKSITSIVTKETSDIIKTTTPSSSRSAPNFSTMSTPSFSTSLSEI